MFYYKMINDEAHRSFLERVTSENYSRWIEHWFDTAYNIRDSFYGQGLQSTGDYIQTLINDQFSVLTDDQLKGTKYERQSD